MGSIVPSIEEGARQRLTARFGSDVEAWFETIQARAERLGAASGMNAERLLGWCVTFAGMVALDLQSREDGSDANIEALRLLASGAP